MIARRFSKRALAATMAASAFGVAITVGVPSAGATSDEDRRFLEIVKELNVPTNSPEEAVQVGREICNTMAAGQIEPARTVRGMLNTLMGQGLEKGQAIHLVWGAVDVYCPRYSSLVGRR